MEALNKAINFFEGQAGLARALGSAQQVIHNWVKRGRVPAEHCPAIERATGGLVRCEDLRPDLAADWAYLRRTDCSSEKLGAGETAPPTEKEAA